MAVGLLGDISDEALLAVIDSSEKRGQERGRRAGISPYLLTP